MYTSMEGRLSGIGGYDDQFGAQGNFGVVE